MAQVKIGIFGCGGMGRHHAKILADMPGVRIAGVCDVAAEKATELGSALGTPCYTDYRDLLDAVDAVWVCTEPFHRLEIVTGAAAAGKHIFTEKPVALTLSEADRMIAAAEAAGVTFMVGYCLRFWNPFKLLRDTFAGGELGELVHCWTRRYMPYDTTGRWYGEQARSGGVALDFGSHDLNWLQWIGGEVEAVYADIFRVRPTITADEHSRSVLRFARGGCGTCDVSWSSCLDDSSVGIVGTAGAMIVDRAGIIRKKIGGGEEVIVDATGVSSFTPDGAMGRQAVAMLGETLYDHFFRCMSEGLEPLTSARDARQTLATYVALREAADSGQVVQVAQVAVGR
ncbi:MAG: Gfo/Idh/MocA family protein [Armatimonadota bacterium]